MIGSVGFNSRRCASKPLTPLCPAVAVAVTSLVELAPRLRSIRAIPDGSAVEGRLAVGSACSTAEVPLLPANTRVAPLLPWSFSLTPWLIVTRRSLLKNPKFAVVVVNTRLAWNAFESSVTGYTESGKARGYYKEYPQITGYQP